MRYTELLLKIVFLADSIYFIVTKSLDSESFLAFLLLTLILGIILIFNKKASYNFKQTKRDLMLRHIEGVIMIAFSAIIYLINP